MSASVPEPSLSQDLVNVLRYWLRGRRGLIAAAVGLAIPALWFGWPWLVAAGVAPLLVAFAPCAIMCGLGLCMSKACAKPGKGTPSMQADPTSLPLQQTSALSTPSTPFSKGCAHCDSPAGTKAPS